MNITKVTVKKIEGQQVLRGVASVVLDDEIKIRDIKILERESGLSIMMPNKKVADGKYRAVSHVVTENNEIVAFQRTAVIQKRNAGIAVLLIEVHAEILLRPVGSVHHGIVHSGIVDGNMGSTGSRTSLPCTRSCEAPLYRLLWDEIVERLSSSVPLLFAGVNLKRSLSCSLSVK